MDTKARISEKCHSWNASPALYQTSWAIESNLNVDAPPEDENVGGTISKSVF